eukprot:COSAG02_NODE_1_length_108762_cov_456.708287_52_plen_43_part_00
MRFVSNDIPTMLPQRRGTKRKVGHGATVRDVLRLSCIIMRSE